MQSVFEVALSNAAVAGIIGLLVLGISRVYPRPALIHCLWLVVLVKLVTPAWISIPVDLPRARIPADLRVYLSLNSPTTNSANSASPRMNGQADRSSQSSAERDRIDGSSNQIPTASVENTGVIEDAGFASMTSDPSHSARTAESGLGSAYRVSLVVCLVGIWILGTCVFLMRSLSRLARFRRLLKFATPAEARVQELVKRLAASMHIKRIPRTLILPGMVSPMLWAFGRRACLLLPGQLMEQLSADAQETVIVHELAHYRRRDHWVRALELVVSSLFWWHPIVWLALRELRQVEEECCDAWVVSQLPDHRGTYARTLVQTMGFLSARPDSMPAAAWVLGKGFYRSVEQRVRLIMSQSPTSGVSMSPIMRFGLVLFAVVVMPLVPVIGDDTTGETGKEVQLASPPADEPTTFAGGMVALGNVVHLAVSPDGRLLAAGHGLAGGPGAFSLWDLRTGQAIGSTVEQRQAMNVAFSPDGKLVAYGTRNASVRVRRTDTLAISQDLTGFTFEPLHVAFSPDGKRFAVGQKGVKLYDTATWKPLPVEFEVDEIVSKETFVTRAVDFSPDGTRILAAGGNFENNNVFGRAVVWECQTGKRLFATPHPHRVDAASFSPDGKQFFAASGIIQIHDAETGDLQRQCLFQRTPCYDVRWSPDGRRIVAGGVVRGIGIFDAVTAEQLHLFGEPAAPKVHLNTVCYTPDGSKIISGNSEKIITVWDAESREVVAQFPSSGATQADGAPVLAIATSLDGRLIAAARDDATITLHNPDDGNVVKVLEGHGDKVAAVAFAATGMLASASYDETIKLWDVQSGAEVRTLAGHDNWVFGIAFSPDGKTLASAGYDKTIRLWNVATGEQTSLIEGHSAGVRAVAFAPDGKQLASASSDRTLKVWDVANQTELAELKGHAGAVRAVAFSPDGKLLASAAEDSSVRLWSTSDWKERHNLAGHQGMVWSVAFSAGGKNLATGGFDNTVKLWNPETGQIRQTLQGHRDIVSSVAFAPDTRALVSGGMDRTLRIWPAGGSASPTTPRN